jgi:hypothetical protein
LSTNLGSNMLDIRASVTLSREKEVAMIQYLHLDFFSAARELS